MPFTVEERRTIELTKVEHAKRLQLAPYPWSRDKFIEILRHNVASIPIEASLQTDKGNFVVARAMLKYAIGALDELEGLESGILEWKTDKDGKNKSFVVETGLPYQR